MACGTCVAACPTGAISREGVSNQEIVNQFPTERLQAPKLITFVCDWSLRESADIEILENYPKELVNVVHIPCTGRIDPQHAMMALKAGVDGVLVCGCKSGECHFKRGTDVASCKIGLLNTMLKQINYPQKQIRFVQIGTQERGRIRYEIEDMLINLDEIGEAKS